MYSVLDYSWMAADGVRMDAYARAIARAVKPGSVVVDIGAGTGICSLIAARAGAARVHAVDTNPAIWLLADLARENGVSDRITIHHKSSYELELAEKADVIISDLRGNVPLHGEHLAVLRDAKTRFLAEGGVLMPERDDLFVGVCEDDEMAVRLARATVGFDRRGCSAAAVRRSLVNTPVSDYGKLYATNLLTTSARWQSITFGAERRPIEGEVELVARRGGTASALAVWFSATTMGDLGYSTEPGSYVVYSRLVLPLLEPIEISAGDRVRVVLRADESGETWAWETVATTPGGEAKARFRQSSFFGMPTSPEALLRSASSFAAVPSPRGERVQQVLGLMDGSRSVAQIAEAMRGSSNVPHATLLEEVRDIVARYGR
jgi:protein arginine N-methyltransferase 1